jgi:single-stranded DNA-binding protein
MLDEQVEHAAQSLRRGSRVLVLGRLQQRSRTAEDGSARSVVEVVAEELGPSWLLAAGRVWTTNERLQHYHLRQGFTYVRTVVLPHDVLGVCRRRHPGS